MPAPRRLVLVPLLILTAGTAWSESGMPISDFRIGADLLFHPKIKERITLDNGEAGGLNWDFGGVFSSPGIRIEATYVQGMSRRDRASSGFVWLVGVNYARWELKPDSYSSNGVFSEQARTVEPKLSYDQFGATVGAGYASQPRYTDVGDLHWEFIPTLRAGWANAETVTPDDANPSTQKGNAPWWELGGKVAMVLQDDNWVLDLHVGYVYGESHQTIDLPKMTVNRGNTDGGESKLDLITSSPIVGLAIGWRF